MDVAAPNRASPIDIIAAIRGLLAEARRLTEQLAEMMKGVRQGDATTAAPASAVVDATRKGKGNLAKVRAYLDSVPSRAASIPSISRGTGIPQSSLRNMIYKTRRDDFEPTTAQGSTEKHWKLVDPPVSIFGVNMRQDEEGS